MTLLDKSVIQELTNIQGLLFVGNAIADNAVYQLSVKFVMPRTTEIVHHKFAHELPLLADEITDYADDRNVYLHRPVVQAQTKEYNNTKEIFDDLLLYMVNLEKIVSKAIDTCVAVDDKVTKVFLDSFLRDLIPYTKMMLGFVDYIEQNGYTPKDNMDMDARINKFMEIEPEFRQNIDDNDDD